MKTYVYALIMLLCAAPARGQESVIQTMMNAVSADSLMTYDRALESAAGYYSRVSFTPGNDSSAQYLLRSFTRSPALATVAFDTFYVPAAAAPYDTKPMVNVYGVLPGKKDPTRAVVIGAHFDSYAGRESTWQAGWQTIHAPGADDNASGVAAVLEMARVFSRYSSMGFSNDYSLIFAAFNCEEAGMAYPVYLYGSDHFATLLKGKGMTLAAMITLDMIGYNTRLTADIVSDSASMPIGVTAVDVNNRYALGLLMNAPPFVYATYSDHSMFWGKQYPAILIIEHAPPNRSGDAYAANMLYHTSSDTSGALNPELMKRTTQLALATAATYAVQQSASDVQTVSVLPPASSALGQNYPNPFNPATRIPFTVAAAQHIRIVVYDVLGRVVATLVDRTMTQGSYAIDWDAHAAQTGTYFCRMTGEKFSDVKKILITK
jgi:Zn-dependent M28 family amino/carboxypeptidase